jgi:hypothetical protein
LLGENGFESGKLPRILPNVEEVDGDDDDEAGFPGGTWKSSFMHSTDFRTAF